MDRDSEQAFAQRPAAKAFGYYQVPPPRFNLGVEVEPRPEAAVKPAAPVGIVESRAWTELLDRPGYWRYTVRWPASGISVGAATDLRPADRLMCDVKVVVGGAPFKFESFTTERVESLVRRAIVKAGVVERPADGWELRTKQGRILTHLVGDAELVDGETVLFLDPTAGGGATRMPAFEKAMRQVVEEGEADSRLFARQEARRPEGKVPRDTRELHVVIENVADTEGPPDFRFIEIENDKGSSIGGFQRIHPPDEINPSYSHIVIPYGRDDAWVSEVAYQAAGAATRPLLEDHPDYVFPAERVRDAVAALLAEFDIPPACSDCQEEQLEVGRAAVEDGAPSTLEHFKEELAEAADDAYMRLLRQREEARAGEDRFKAERDSALRLLRWLIGDLIPVIEEDD